MSYKFGDRITVWPEGDRVSTWSYTAGEFQVTHDGIYSKLDESDNSVLIIFEDSESNNGYDESWVPTEWIHEEGYKPVKIEFHIECRYADASDDEFIKCPWIHESFDNILDAQERLEDHRREFTSYTARLMLNDKVVG